MTGPGLDHSGEHGHRIEAAMLAAPEVDALSRAIVATHWSNIETLRGISKVLNVSVDALLGIEHGGRSRFPIGRSADRAASPEPVAPG
jgi:hypothetical protein